MTRSVRVRQEEMAGWGVSGESAGEEGPGLRQCGKGHRSSAVMETAEGGIVCLVCFSNLVSDPEAPSHHISYALSQLSRAMAGGGCFFRELRTVHGHLLVLPLVQVLSSSDDEPLARQAVDLVSELCSVEFECADSAVYSPGESLSRDFISRIADRLSSGALAWSRRQVYMLHCLGVLLVRGQAWNPSTCIRNKAELVMNLIAGLQLPSEEIRGEILFVLYKLFALHDHQRDDNDEEEGESLVGFRMLSLSFQVLLKTQNDDVRTNCIALLTVLIRKGYFKGNPGGITCRRRANFVQSEVDSDTPLVNLFADAVKAPLLSSDSRVQIGALDLIFHSISMELYEPGDIKLLIEENIPDYVFEILRLSGNNDPLIVPCLRVLDLLTAVDNDLGQRLALGFPTLLSVLHYVAAIPLHPVQYQAMKLVWHCMSNCPGIISMSQVEELAVILTGMFARYSGGELGMLSETFILACLTFAEVLKSPSSYQIRRLETLVQETLSKALLSSLSTHKTTEQLLLYSLYLVKEAILYAEQETSLASGGSGEEIMNCIAEICESCLLPWLGAALNDGEDEDTVMEILEIFHLILLQGSNARKANFAESLASSSWISWSFGYLALLPSGKMKCRLYLLLSLVLDCIFGLDFGESIRSTHTALPSDPMELLFLLGQRSACDDSLLACQSAVISILHSSTLFEERIADEDQVLASLEQYLLVNGCNFSLGIIGSALLTQLVHLYSFTRGVLSTRRVPYSQEAERILFCLISQHDWDLLSIGIHPAALKWLFQQDAICVPLSRQILNFCRSCGTDMHQLNKFSKIVRMADVSMFSDLVVSEDNCFAVILVGLLPRLDGESQEDDLNCVMNVMISILIIVPEASRQFCLRKVSNAIHRLCYSHYPREVFVTVLLLAFNILTSASSEVLSEDTAWLPITIKLIESVIPLIADDSSSPEVLCLLVGILCLVLCHSVSKALVESAKAILLNTALISAVHQKVNAACYKGPALVHLDEETSFGESLLLILLLYFFSLKSLSSLLQEAVHWEDFITAPDRSTTTSVISISCVDLCRLLHYGSRTVKLVASQCLVELLNRISPQRVDPHHSSRPLRSMMAVTEGLVFYEDPRVAMNCGLCSSIILGWEDLRSTTKWCRLISEELTLLLVAPGLASRSFKAQHKPAAQIVKVLLGSAQPVSWTKFVFSPSCISSIIKSVSPSNVTLEIVELFRELAMGKHMDEEQVAALQQIFLACRKQMYRDSGGEQCQDELPLRILISCPEEAGKLCAFLIRLMLSPGNQPTSARLMDEIDWFFQAHKAT